ncbi:universal stress protein [Candidatus Nitrotoga arctica]|uniref:Universal stress protein n=1 Tax=Candidatus Nitrotoga arctica TaxID=453162 RepID=A0ABN8AM11_9PROT|nr:universal stress protein [Candidatus Nitrotoga arctica]CAG9931465.1 Universal stress protein [Candidatus Nitrotoga arctica]
MYTRMVVAVDGSETSGKALDEAIKLAREMSSIILLLHVCEEMPIMWEPDGMNMILMQNSLKAVSDAGKELLEKHRRQLAAQGITVETKLVETYGGRIGSVIAEEAQKWNADLLVVGTHGRKGIAHLLMGSVAEGVTRSASMPVLLVRR